MDALTWLFPRTCPLCGKRIPLLHEFCSCSSASPHPVPDDATLIHPDDPVQLRHLTAPYYYSGQIRSQLLMLKFQAQTRYVKPLGAAMAAKVLAAFPSVSFDCVTFVPMTEADICVRSLNQSALLAQTVAEKLFIECKALLVKTKSTIQQHTLHQAERLDNLQNVFAPTAMVIPGQTVLLVDDIKTTGTTLFRCCEALYAAGIRDVYCVCAAASEFWHDDSPV